MQTLMLFPIIFPIIAIYISLPLYILADLCKGHKHPIIKITKGSLGVTLVFRSLLSRQWLFNISIGSWALDRFNPKPTLKLATLALLAMVYWACDSSNPVASSQDGVKQDTAISMRYVMEGDTAYPNCWFTNGRDSLNVDGRHYVISTRSRYRAHAEPETFGDTYAEGPYTLIQARLYYDTKRDTVFAFNHCAGR
jgi:hypothetical protein